MVSTSQRYFHHRNERRLLKNCFPWKIMWIIGAVGWIRHIKISPSMKIHQQHGVNFYCHGLSIKARSRPRIAVIGGGASGIFASIAASEGGTDNATPSPHVTVLEATSQTLQKVKISGGGRCNVLHDTSKTVPTLLSGYPRGQKELNGLFHKHFTPTMAREWFENRGVTLKTEGDGRMFPTTDSSETIIKTLLQAAESQGVEILKRCKVTSIQHSDSGYLIQFKDESQQEFDAVIMATGSSPTGYGLLQALEQPMDSTVPSLFTLNVKTEIQEGGLLYGLSGVSVPTARVTLLTLPAGDADDGGGNKNKKARNNKKKHPSQEGPLLITHHGLSGPAVLRLSAFAAHEFKAQNYRGPIRIHWDTTLGDNIDVLLDELWKVTTSNPKRTVASACPLANHSIPRRLWSALVLYTGFAPDAIWGNTSKKMARQLANNLVACEIQVTGKGTFKDEFVTAGGVSLKSMNMKRMESKIHRGLFICGELLNVDGVTGGFNFMNCWSTGYVAGHSAVEYCQQLNQYQQAHKEQQQQQQI